uniref:RNase H type-1 domain-containing protein n=1 Tax=Cannabis sativa TaxID=3483 RepID=A0A803QEU8_CANSA
MAFLMRLAKGWTKVDYEMFLVLCWQQWFTRNNTKHGGGEPRATDVVEWCAKFLSDYQGQTQRAINTQLRSAACWAPPVQGMMQINVDGGVKKGVQCTGTGCVVRDCEGRVQVAIATSRQQEVAPLQAELLAIKEGLLLGIQRKYRQFCIESDCISFVYREANGVAHGLANYALVNKASAMWIGVNSSCVSLAIERDMPNSM